METAVKMPLSQRVNVRMIIFAAVVLFLIGTPVYIFVHEKITGGIENYGSYVKVDLKAMSDFPFDQTNGAIEDIPQRWRDLDGKRVLLAGEMWTGGSAAAEVGSFDLCYSIAKCCFSGPPQVQHFVHSRVAQGGRVDFYTGLVNVVGTLHVRVKKEAGKVASVYELDVEKLQPVQ